MLLDLDRPRLTGLEVLERLAKLKQAEDVPVIVMTAHGSIQTALEAMKDGACDFLTQPLDKDHLLIVIRKALAQAPAHLFEIRNGQSLCISCWHRNDNPDCHGSSATSRPVRRRCPLTGGKQDRDRIIIKSEAAPQGVGGRTDR